MQTAFLALRSVIYMTVFLLLFAGLALWARGFDRRLGVILPAAGALPGVVLAVAGALLVLACAGVFIWRGRGTPALFDAPRAFVAVGPYRYARNPMYLGGLLLLLGFGLWERSLSILLFAALLCPLTHLLVVFYEEPTLRKRFGASYREYLEKVPRWLPRPPHERLL